MPERKTVAVTHFPKKVEHGSLVNAEIRYLHAD